MNRKEKFLKEVSNAYDKVYEEHLKGDGDIYELEDNISHTFKKIQGDLMSEIQKAKQTKLQKKMSNL